MRNTPPLLVGLQAGTPALGINLTVPQKTRNSSASRPSYTTPGHIPKRFSTMFIATLFIIARSWKQPRCLSMEEWIQKMWYIMEYYSPIKNGDFMNFVGKWM